MNTRSNVVRPMMICPFPTAFITPLAARSPQHPLRPTPHFKLQAPSLVLLRPFPGTTLATTRPTSPFRTTLTARVESRRRFPSPDWGGSHEARHNTMDAPSFGIFLTAFMSHGSLASTSNFAHGRQFPTTKGEGRGHLDVEWVYRSPQYREGNGE